MAKLAPLDLKAWIDEHRHLLAPPVGNAMVWKDSDFQVMVIGGPKPAERLSRRSERGALLPSSRATLSSASSRTANAGTSRSARARCCCSRPSSPTAPSRGSGTIGLVIERQRKPGETEALRWYCDRCGKVLHEATLRVTDLGVQLKPVIESFYADESLRTCKKCGAVLQPPARVR